MAFLSKENLSVYFSKSKDLFKTILHDAFLKKGEEVNHTSDADSLEKFLASYGMILIAVVVNLIGVYMCTIYKKTTQKQSVLTRDELMRIPLMLSCSLFGIFCFLKVISIEYMTFAIQVYTLLYGFLSLGTCFGIFLDYLWVPTFGNNREFHLSLTEKDKDVYSCDVKYSDLVGYLISGCVVIGYYVKKSWILNNVVAASFTFTLLDNIVLDKFWHSCILFVGLFLYDIFWVYGTNVMVTVAKKIDAPLMFKLPYRLLTPTVTVKYTGLGLGDVAVPGLFLAFLARFDLSQKKVNYHYFGVGMASYIFSLMLCTIVVNTTGHGQPAFFYIVPIMFSSILVLTLVKKELPQLMAFNAESSEEKPKTE